MRSRVTQVFVEKTDYLIIICFGNLSTVSTYIYNPHAQSLSSALRQGLDNRELQSTVLIGLITFPCTRERFSFWCCQILSILGIVVVVRRWNQVKTKLVKQSLKELSQSKAHFDCHVLRKTEVLDDIAFHSCLRLKNYSNLFHCFFPRIDSSGILTPV